MYQAHLCPACNYNLSHWREKPPECPSCGAALKPQEGDTESFHLGEPADGKFHLWAVFWALFLTPLVFSFAVSGYAWGTSVLMIGSLASGFLLARLLAKPALGFVARALVLSVVLATVNLTLYFTVQVVLLAIKALR